MRKTISSALVVFVIAALVGVGAASANAPLIASGSTFFAPFPDYFTVVKDTGSFTDWCTEGNPGGYSGTFSGTRTLIGCVRTYHDGRFKFEGTILFTGTVEGCGTGTVVFKTVGEGGPNSGVLKRSRDVAIGGTLGVRGTLDSVGDVSANTLTYTGSYSC